MVDGINTNNSSAQFSVRPATVNEQTSSKNQVDESTREVDSDSDDSFNVALGENTADQGSSQSVSANLSINNVNQQSNATNEKQADLKSIENEIRKSPGVAIEVQANQSVDTVVHLVS